MYVNTKKMLQDARAGHYCVLGVDCWGLDTARLIVDRAVAKRMPVIVLVNLKVPPTDLREMEMVTMVVKDLAARTDVPIAVQLDHGASFEEAAMAIHAGFSAVMLDASALPFDENVAAVKEVVRMAHACGVTVEAELGHVGKGADWAEEDESFLTEVDEAAEYVRQTGVDSLAVSIGTIHGQYSGTPHLDYERLAKIAAATDIPLVLHGGSGTGLPALRKAVDLGISKLNVMTDVLLAYNSGYDADAKFKADSMEAAASRVLDEYLDTLCQSVK